MGFFDNLKGNAKELADKAAAKANELSEKAKDAVEISKLNTKISEQEKGIKDLKVQLGEIVWNEFLADACNNEEAKAVCGKIKEALDVIEGLKAEIEKIKNEPSTKTVKELAAETAKDVGEKVNEVVQDVKEKVENKE